MTPDERRAKQRENQDYFSEKISTLTQYIAFGLAAAGFALISSDSAFFTSLSDISKKKVLAAAVAGCVSVILDYVQALTGWLSASRAAENDAGGYRIDRIGKAMRRIQTFVFYLKQVSAIAGSLTLIAALWERL